MRYLPLVAILLSILPGVGSAQCPEDARLHAQRELELTDQRIEQAIGVVGQNAPEPARLELGAARETQTRARGEFAAQRCRIAVDLTVRARFRASRAIEIVRGGGGPPGGGGPGDPGLPDPGRLLSQLERTRDLLDRARDRIEECGDDQARAILRAAFEMQHRAEDALAQQRTLAAFQLTVSARERALRALRLCNMQDNLRESAERALRRTDELLSRARDVVIDRNQDRGRRVLRRAIELQERATVEFRAERFEGSLRLTQSARTLAQRAVRLAGGTL